jgi:hypothetical protein
MATQDAAVEVAQLPLRFDQYSSTALRVSLTEATSMGTPGAVMDSFSLTSDPAAMALYSGMFSLRPALTAGKQYWLTVTTESNFASVVWGGTHSFFPRDPSHPVGAIAQRSLSPTIPPGQPWYVFLPAIQSAFRLEGEIIGSQVPEPSAFLLAGAGLGFLVYRRRRR